MTATVTVREDNVLGFLLEGKLTEEDYRAPNPDAPRRSISIGKCAS